MYTLGRASSRTRSVNIWPGFVDGLSTLLLVVIFVLMVFMVAQYYLSVALTGRDQQLSKLNRDLEEAKQLLILERNANADLRINIAQLSSELQTSLEARDELQTELRSLIDRREALSAELASASEARDSLADQLAALRSRSENEEDKLAAALEAGDALRNRLQQAQSVNEEQAQELRQAYETMAADKEKIEAQLAEIAALQELRDSLRGDLLQARSVNEAQAEELRQTYETIEADKEKIDAQLAELASLQELRDRLRNELEQAQSVNEEQAQELRQAYETIDADKETIEAQLAELRTLQELRDELDAELAKRENALAALAERSDGLEEELETSEADRQALAEQLEIIENRLTESQDFAMEQQALSEEARREVRLLNRQLASLRRRLRELNGLLEASEARNEAQEAQIVDLGKRLNAALATKVQELARYRSEFFGRLREILGDTRNIRIVGDRFVFQAEVLFPTASATLEPAGRDQIEQLAGLLREVAAKIPPDIDWVLRVDGHTDIRPISTPQFPSNWELSTARAVEVVKVLIEEGIPPNRLAAAGFGEYQPIDESNTESAFRRNRRIEFKLTER